MPPVTHDPAAHGLTASLRLPIRPAESTSPSRRPGKSPGWRPRRHGIGRALIDAVTIDARVSGARLLHVKTLADSHPSPEYAQTRAFYGAIGFERLIVIPDLWDPSNPCLLMVRPL